MRNNKIISIILALGLCASITACGAEKENTNNASGSTNAAARDIKEQKPTSEILEADIYSKKIQLGNHVFTLPITLEELIADGAVVTDTEQSLSDMIQSANGYTYPLKMNIDGFDYALQFVNRAELSDDGTMPNLPLSKCTFDSVIESIGNNKQDMILPKGIKKGMTLDELKAAWGEPTDYSDSYPDTYVYCENPSSNEYVAFIINLDTQLIDCIDVNYHAEQ